MLGHTNRPYTKQIYDWKHLNSKAFAELVAAEAGTLNRQMPKMGKY